MELVKLIKPYVIVKECEAGKRGQILFITPEAAQPLLDDKSVIQPGVEKSMAAFRPENYQTK